MKTEHDSFLAFYLTQTDEAAVAFKETRFGLAPYEVPENEEVNLKAVDFQLVR
jgi:RNA polymerase II-associated factor 1